jgi:hypothetical protein
MVNPWATWLDAAQMTLQAQQVIAMRTMRLARGGPLAMVEMQRMVGEKALAFWLSQIGATTAAASGIHATSRKALAPYSRTVRRNRRRLARARK